MFILVFTDIKTYPPGLLTLSWPFGPISVETSKGGPWVKMKDCRIFQNSFVLIMYDVENEEIKKTACTFLMWTVIAVKCL